MKAFSAALINWIDSTGLPKRLPCLARLRSGWSLLLLGFGACWLLFFNELRGEWVINPQYNYGWLVPLLGAALGWRRWLERPVTGRLVSWRAPLVLGAALLAITLPLRIALEANPEWRLLYWLHGLQLLGLSFCLLYGVGGWLWIKHLAFPLAFMLIAVPWPMEFEQLCIQGLMRQVAALTVEIAGWFGIAGVQHGNLIQVGAGMVGIDEACSGVRSLQTALMLSLFLGELYRFAVARRFALICASLVFVIVANLTRTVFLVWAAANRGILQMEAWHDLAGNLVMVIVLPSLMLLAYFMNPRKSPQPMVNYGAAMSLRSPSPWIGIGVLAWLLTTEAVTELWYRAHEKILSPAVKWSLNWPEQDPAFKKKSVPATALAILRCSTSEAGCWSDEDGNEWSAFLLRWTAGKNSAQLAKGHRPDICMPASGASLQEDFGQVTFPIQGFELPFKHQTFVSGTKLIHVFYCLWSDRVAPNEKAIGENGTRVSRIGAILAGKRHLGQQVLEIFLQGPESREEAVTLLRNRLPDLIRPQTRSGQFTSST